MKMNFKKIITTICGLALVFNLTSCNNEDDKIPCTDQELSAFRFIIKDNEENMLFESEEFEKEDIVLTTMLNDEEHELEFEIKTSSDDITYISSLEMSELSLEEGISAFEFRFKDNPTANINLTVSSENSNLGCLTFTYNAKSKDENLETITTGNITAYVVLLDLP
jgi:hypothetical protein